MRIVYFIILFTFVLNYAKNQGLTNSLANISHENLLDNPWFTVNQRGQSSYSLSANAYTVDRWKSLLTVGTMGIGVNSNGVQITETSNVDDGIFYQLISNQSLLGGKTVTISIDDGTNIYHATGVTLSAKPVNWEYICAVETTNGVKLELVQSPTFVTDYDFYFGIRVPKDGTAYTIKAVKLELGSVSTLAMDTAPNYQQELAKCQRYFYRYKAAHTGFYFGLAIAWNTNKMSMILTVPCMRSTATITPSDFSDFLVSKGASSVSPHNITNFENLGQSEQNHASGLLITTSESDLTSGDIYVLKAVNSSAYIDFSADL